MYYDYEGVGGEVTKIHTMAFSPPGFPKQAIGIPFPECRLPVCERCKKNYKTRELCRNRDRHTSLPWTGTYVCITVDESCSPPEQKDTLIEGGIFLAEQAEPMPYRLPDEVGDKDTPICTFCKEKNYTKAYCRIKQGHRELPWNTVYAKLTIGDASSWPNPEDRNQSVIGKDGVIVFPREDGSRPENIVEGSDDLSKLPASRTFVAKVSNSSCLVKWLDPCKESSRSRQLFSHGGSNKNDLNSPYFNVNGNPYYLQNQQYPSENSEYNHYPPFYSHPDMSSSNGDYQYPYPYQGNQIASNHYPPPYPPGNEWYNGHQPYNGTWTQPGSAPNFNQPMYPHQEHFGNSMGNPNDSPQQSGDPAYWGYSHGPVPVVADQNFSNNGFHGSHVGSGVEDHGGMDTQMSYGVHPESIPSSSHSPAEPVRFG